MILLTCRINKIQMNLSIKQKQNQRTNLQLPRGRKIRGGMDWEFRVSRYKQLHIE